MSRARPGKWPLSSLRRDATCWQRWEGRGRRIVGYASTVLQVRITVQGAQVFASPRKIATKPRLYHTDQESCVDLSCNKQTVATKSHGAWIVTRLKSQAVPTILTTRLKFQVTQCARLKFQVPTVLTTRLKLQVPNALTTRLPTANFAHLY